MMDDDFLIDEADDVDDGQEEDLLADVDVPAAAQSWEWSDPPAASVAAAAPAVLQPDPPADEFVESGATMVMSPDPAAGAPSASGAQPSVFAPASAQPPGNGRADFDAFFDEPPGTVPLATAMAQGVPPAPRVEGLPALVVEPVGPTEGTLAGTLQTLGFTVTVVETGSAARDELYNATHRLVFLVVDGDIGWARMLVMATAQRDALVRFVCVLPSENDPAAQQLSAVGAAAVLQGMPAPARLLAMVKASAPELFPNDPEAPQLAAELAAIREQLSSRMAATEARAADAEARAQEASRAASEREREITGVRSEMTGMRQRCEVLQDRVLQAESEVTRLRDALGQAKRQLETSQQATGAAELAAQQAASRTVSSEGNEKLKKLATSVGPYGAALDQALEFLNQASRTAAHGTPAEWARHIKNLTLTRQLMKKLETHAGK